MYRNRTSLAVIAAVVFSVFNLSNLPAQENPVAYPDGCVNISDSAWQAYLASFKKRDTIQALAIWASSNFNPRGTKLPTFWRQIWDSGQQISVPRFYKNNSDSAGVIRYVLNVDVFGAPDSNCFVAGGLSRACEIDDDFFRAILTQADAYIDFRNYDRNNDTYVDAIFFCIYDSLDQGLHLCINGTFNTKDSVGGVPMKIVQTSGVHAYTLNREELVQTMAHEWGHGFGLLDYYALSSCCWWVTGSFTVMGKSGFQHRASPFHPFQNHKFLGWDQPIDINTTTYNQQIEPYMSSVKKAYRIKKSATEYFEVSYHRAGLASFPWEQFWPANGLLIAHINENVATPQNFNLKQMDLELPHGLRTYIGGLPDTCYPNCFTTPNDSTGYDSLDVNYVYRDTLINLGTNIGSATCLWNASTKQYFDDKTNPSSRVYGTYGQNAFSKLAVENIQINGATASADFIIDAKYGGISSNTTWGPGLVSVIGDVTVESGATLTIQPGTTLKFQKNYDNMQSGGSAKSQLIVEGTLTCLGSQTDSIIFTSSAIAPANGDWGGMLVAFPGRANIEFTRFSYADTALSVQGDTATVYVYNSTFTHFNTAAVYSRSAKVRLGGIVPIPVPPDCGKNNFLMNTATSGAKAVIKSTLPSGTLKAEGNWWSQAPPPSSWFVGSVDRTPHLLGYATPDSCIPFGQFSQPPQEGRIVAIGNVPTAFELGQNYPNPFNPTTTIQYALPEPAQVELKIFNTLGQVVRTLMDGHQGAGYHQIVWDGKDEAGRTVATGVYLCQIKAGDFVKTMKMSFIK